MLLLTLMQSTDWATLRMTLLVVEEKDDERGSCPCLEVRRPLLFGGWPARETSVPKVDQCGQKAKGV